LVILTNWFPRTGRGLLLGCWACDTSVGDLIGTNIYKVFSKDPYEWNRSFYIVAGIVFLMGFINFFLLIQEPREVGIVFKTEEPAVAIVEEETHALEQEDLTILPRPSSHEGAPVEFKVTKKMNFLQSLTMPGIIAFSVSFFLIKLTQYGIYYWYPTYLQEAKDFEK